MYFMYMMFFFYWFLVFFLYSISWLINYKNLFNREKNSSFECGFNKISSSRLPFSIQFFILCLLFLIFDIEVTLIIPMILSFQNLNLYLILISMIFLVILIFGTMLEWLDNSFNWMI